MVALSQVAFVMELCRCSLSGYLSHFGCIHEADRVAWSNQMCTGLGHIHECSVIHRDIKPENLLLQSSPGGQDFLNVADFGNACIVVEDLGTRPLPPNLKELVRGVTTYIYAAPEILRGERYDYRSDVWSAGVVMYELMQQHPARTAIKLEQSDTMDSMLPKTLEFANEVSKHTQSGEIPDLKLVQEMLREAFIERPSMQDLLNRVGFCPITSWRSADTDTERKEAEEREEAEKQDAKKQDAEKQGLTGLGGAATQATSVRATP